MTELTKKAMRAEVKRICLDLKNNQTSLSVIRNRIGAYEGRIADLTDELEQVCEALGADPVKEARKYKLTID